MDRHPDTAGGQAPLRALVVDDEAPLVGLVTRYLEREGFQVRAAGDGLHAVELARTFQPEVIVLDLMLPRLDGIEACRQIRTFSDAYVVMLTARTEEVDKLVGLGVGADDYLTKPFSPRELVARIRAMLRRPRATAPMPADAGPVRRIGELVIDPAAREVQLAGGPVELPRLEFDLLRPCPSGRGWCSAAVSSWSESGEPTGTATTIWSTCTSPTCAENSATTPDNHATSSPSAESAIAWEVSGEHADRTGGGQSGRQAVAGADAGGHRWQPYLGRGRAGRGPRGVPHPRSHGTRGCPSRDRPPPRRGPGQGDHRRTRNGNRRGGCDRAWGQLPAGPAHYQPDPLAGSSGRSGRQGPLHRPCPRARRRRRAGQAGRCVQHHGRGAGSFRTAPNRTARRPGP